MRKLTATLMLSALGAAGLFSASPAIADPIVSAPRAVSLAIYGDGRSVVREQRSVEDFADGGNASILGLPNDLDLSSLSVEMDGVPAASLEIRNDVVAPSSLLRRSLGRSITWLAPIGTAGEERAFTGTLISIANGIILEIDGRLEVMPPGRLVLDRLPPGMTEGLEVQANLQPSSGPGALVARYLTPNLFWSADYDAVLSLDSDSAVLSGRYAIRNNTETDFDAATVRLVAGEITRSGLDERAMMAEMQREEVFELASAKSAPRAARLGDVHVYDLPGTIRLPANRMTRSVLLPPSPVSAVRRYRLEGSGVLPPDWKPSAQEGLRPKVVLELKNDTGQALPAGVIRVFGALENDGSTAPPVVLGEAWLGHLPVDETATLGLGSAFDVIADRRVSDYENLGKTRDRARDRYRVTHEIALRNSRTETVEVAVHEFLGLQQLRFVESSLAPSEQDADSVTWLVSVPAGGTVTLSYTARVDP